MTVSQRLAERLRKLFAAARHGSQARLVAFSKTRPGGSNISAQNLSYFLNGRRTAPIGLDDLDDLAAFFELSIGELLGERSTDLTGEEQRLIWYWRELPAATRQHVLGLIAPASLTRQSLPVQVPPVAATGTDDAIVTASLYRHMHD